jgi:hypothetical protein
MDFEKRPDLKKLNESLGDLIRRRIPRRRRKRPDLGLPLPPVLRHQPT